jgi:hypothetical protein
MNRFTAQIEVLPLGRVDPKVIRKEQEMLDIIEVGLNHWEQEVRDTQQQIVDRVHSLTDSTKVDGDLIRLAIDLHRVTAIWNEIHQSHESQTKKLNDLKRGLK